MEQPSTLEQFQWMLRDTALWAVDAHSPAGGLPEVQRALEELGIYYMEFGSGVRVRNRYDLNRMPDRSIVTINNPGDERYRVYLWKQGRFTQILGGSRTMGNGPYLIFEAPGLPRPAWLDVQPGPDETGRIQSWKKQAWNVGYKAKERNSWCPTFERVMESMGVYG